MPGDKASCAGKATKGDRLIIEPAPARLLLALLATLDPIEDAFPEVPELPTDLVNSDALPVGHERGMLRHSPL